MSFFRSSKIRKRIHNNASILIFLFFFLVYFYSGMENVSSSKSLEYGGYFSGIDSPLYVKTFTDVPERNWQVYTKHPITFWICNALQYLTDPFLSMITQIKLVFALFGALGVLFAYKLFNLISKRYAVLFAATYGFSGSVWLFSSLPESYIISSFVTTLYFYYFYLYKDKLVWKSTWILTFILVISILNEIISLFVIILPLAHLLVHKKYKKLKYWIVHGIFGGGIGILILYLLFPYIFRFYFHLSQRFVITSGYKLYQVILNCLFFNVIFPVETILLDTAYDPAVKYFSPHINAYYGSIISVIALLLYLIIFIIVIINIKKTYKLILPLIFFISARILLIFLFNAFEAFIYSAVLNLTILLVILFTFNKLKYGNSLLHTFLLIEIINNASFFIFIL